MPDCEAEVVPDKCPGESLLQSDTVQVLMSMRKFGASRGM